MKAIETCVWEKECSIRMSSGCPIENMNYHEEDDLTKLCELYHSKLKYMKEEKTSSCPPHDPEEVVLFQFPRYFCKKCGKELKGENGKD